MKERSAAKEQLDNLALQGEPLHKALQSLSWINYWFGNNRSAIESILFVYKKRELPFRITDLGCGGGDVTAAIARALDKKKIAYQITGIDGNEHTLAYARKNSLHSPCINFLKADILDPDFKTGPCDVLFSSHFVYHFTEDGLISFLQKNRSSVTTAFIFSELERSRLAIFLFKYLSALLPISKLAKKDGLLAIKRSFSKKEWMELLQKAGITTFHISRFPLFRLQIIIYPQ